MSGNPTGEHKIKEIKKKSSCAIVLFADGEKLKLSPSTFSEFRLYKEKILEEEEYAKILRFQAEDVYYDKALSYLGKDNYTVYSLSKKLLDKGATQEQVDSIVKRLSEDNLLDDARYAKTYAEDVAAIRCLGKKRVLRDLKEKGVSAEILASLSFSDEEELSKALLAANLYDRKYSRATNRSKMEKVIVALIQRGFSDDIARKAAHQQVTTADPATERAKLERDYELASIRYGRKFEGFEKERRVMAYLLKQGYEYDDVRTILDEKAQEEKE